MTWSPRANLQKLATIRLFRQQFLARNLDLLLEALKRSAVRTIETPKRHVKSKKGRILP